MADAFETIRTHQVIFVFVLGGIFTVLSFAAGSWVKRLVEDRAKAVDLVSVGAHVSALEGRVAGLERAVQDMPTTLQMRDIAVSLADIRGELKAGTERFKGLEALLKIQREEVQQIDEYLRTRKVG